MAGRNEPGGGVVPSALAEIRRAMSGDAQGLTLYITAVLLIGIAIVTITAMA